MKLVVDAVNNKSGGGATILLEILRAAIAINRFREITVLASTKELRAYKMPTSARLRVVDVVEAEGNRGRIMRAMQGFDRHLRKLEFDAFLGLNGMGSVQQKFPSLALIQNALQNSRH